MAEDSRRRGASPVGPLLLAVIFLAVLGGGVGFSLGTLSKHQRNAATTQSDGSGTSTPDAGNGTGTTPAVSQGSAKRCPQHTEQLAGAGQLTQLLYLRTAQSEVWICKDRNGTLYYQGHKGGPGDPLVEGSTALFLTDVQREQNTDNGYVATNTDPAGPITKYHVRPRRLVREYINYQTPKPSETEEAVD
jgi:hypothetical protein